MRIRYVAQGLLQSRADITKVPAGHMGPQLLFQQCLHLEECAGDTEKGILFFLIS